MTTTTKTKTRVEFKRGRASTTDCRCCPDWMRWRSRCGVYQVSQAKYHDEPTRYFATYWHPSSWHFVEYCTRYGRHQPRTYRTRRAAERACDKHLAATM